MTIATITNSFSEGVPLPAYLVQFLDRFPVPAPDQELELIQKAKKGHEFSSTCLMVGHVRLVSKLAAKYAKTFDDGQDMLQEGMLGIRHAIGKFDPTKGYKFSTYARGWILGYIRRFWYRNRPEQLRLPEQKQMHLDRIYKFQREFPDDSSEQIAQKANLELEYVEALLVWGRSFQELPDWKEFPCFDDPILEEDESLDVEVESKTQTNVPLIKAPPPFIPPKYQIPVHLLKQWFQFGLAQFVNAAKSQLESPRLGLTQGFTHTPAREVSQERLNLSTWPTSLSFSYKNSTNTTVFSSQASKASPSTIIHFVQGAIAHAQKSLLVLCGFRSDGPADRPGDQSAPADQRCRGLEEPGTIGRGYLGFRKAVTRFIQRPLASVISSIRGFSSRAGPDPERGKREGAVFDSNPPPQQTDFQRTNTMYKTIAAFIVAWLGLRISPATAETIKIAPGHGHLIDLSASGCRVSKAYMGTRGIFDLSLDQPQPQTQKIYLTWKPNAQVKSTNLILDLVGCNRSSMELTINRSDGIPKTAITRIGTPTPIARPPEQPHALTRPPVGALPPGAVASTPLTLQPIAKRPAPKTVKRPPVRKLTLSQQTSPDLTAEGDVSDIKVTPSILLRGLNVARASGDETYRYRSDMHWRVNGMIRQMRWGATTEVAAKRANVSPDQLQALIDYAQQ